MKKRNTKIRNMTAGALAFLLLCALAVMPAFAMQPLEAEIGTRSWCVFPADGPSELKLENLALTYEINHLPEEDYESAEELLSAGSTLRAEYTFYNPTSVEQTVNMLLPAGDLPLYIDYTEFEKDENLSLQSATSYEIELDGQPVKPVLRGAWRPESAAVLTFNGHTPGEYADQLQDSFAEHAFLTADLPVTVYTYQPVADQSGGFYYRMSASFDHSDERTWVFTDERTGIEQERDCVVIGKSVWEDSYLTLYVLGEDIGELDWELTDSDGRVMGSARVVSRQSTTFGELAMQYYDPDSAVAEHDWYNAVVDMMTYSHVQGTGVLGWETQVDLNVTAYLQYYLAYDVTLAPGQRTVNTVIAPAYPDAMRYYSPVACTFAFDMPRASDWASVGTFSLRINTKFKMVPDEARSIDADEYDKNRKGYSYQSDSVPDGTWRFTLSQRKNPIISMNVLFYGILAIVIGVPLIVILGVVAIAVLVIVLIVRRRRRNKKTKKQAQQDKPEQKEDAEHEDATH